MPDDYEKMSDMSSMEPGGEGGETEVQQRKRRMVSHISVNSPLAKLLGIGANGLPGAGPPPFAL